LFYLPKSAQMYFPKNPVAPKTVATLNVVWTLCGFGK
jgi:hypothetical protein